MCRHAPLFALVGLVLTLAGCGASAPAPTAPTTALQGVTALTIGGVPASPTVGQTAQLKALASFPDGTQKDATSAVTWQSSDPAVATTSTAGVLTIAGTGTADVTVALQSVRGTAQITVATTKAPVVPVPATYEISGVVHETVPTEDVPVAGAVVAVHFVGCPTCPNDGQTATTDRAGRFTLSGIQGPGFTLSASRPGYDATSYGVVALPRDQHPEMALAPTFDIVTEDRTGVATEDHTGSAARCDNDGPWSPSMFPEWEFAVHHSGPARLILAENIGWGSTSIDVYQALTAGTVRFWKYLSYLGAGSYPTSICGPGRACFGIYFPAPGGPPAELMGGFKYRVVFGTFADARPCGPVHGIWSHPN